MTPRLAERRAFKEDGFPESHFISIMTNETGWCSNHRSVHGPVLRRSRGPSFFPAQSTRSVDTGQEWYLGLPYIFCPVRSCHTVAVALPHTHGVLPLHGTQIVHIVPR